MKHARLCFCEGFERSAQENCMLEHGNKKKEERRQAVIFFCTSYMQNVEITVMKYAVPWLRSQNCIFTGFNGPGPKDRVNE